MKLRIAAVVISIAVLFVLQQLLMPKYMSGIYEGAMISEYYQSEKNHQIAIIGDCEVYENISPITLWREYGYTSFIRGSAQQTVWQSYYLLEDTLRYETPELVIFNVLSLKFNEPQNEAYNRMSIDGMRLSTSKLGAAKASMMPEETLMSYIFPILRYHERWKELTMDDVKYIFKPRQVTHNGFLMRMDVKPVTVIPKGNKLKNYQFGETAYEYLDKITELCRSKGIPLLLIKAPSIFPYWYPEWEEQMEQYAKNNSLTYINTLEISEQIGIDFNTDTYDAGLHLNCQGAEKLSQYLGGEISRLYGLEDKRSDSELSKVWEQKGQLYDAMRSAQLSDIANYGKVQTFHVK